MKPINSKDYVIEKINVLAAKKPKRTVLKGRIVPANWWSKPEPKKYETFEEYAHTLGVSALKKKRKKRKSRIEVMGCNRVRVAKQPPKPKRMIRVDYGK